MQTRPRSGAILAPKAPRCNEYLIDSAGCTKQDYLWEFVRHTGEVFLLKAAVAGTHGHGRSLPIGDVADTVLKHLAECPPIRRTLMFSGAP